MTIIASFIIGLVSCEKEGDEITKETIMEAAKDTVKINYTIIVNDAANASMYKSTNSTNRMDGATVIVSVDGQAQIVTTDANGYAMFTDLRAGTIAVAINKDGFTPVNMVVDLGSNEYENDTEKRNASTMVSLFPVNGSDMKTISGYATMQLDVTVSFDTWSVGSSSYTESEELENAPQGTEIVATINNDVLSSYVSTYGNGQVLNVAYENVTFKGAVGSNGSYSISVPTAAKGLEMTIHTESVEADIKYSALTLLEDGSYEEDANGNFVLTTKTEKHIYTAVPIYIKVNQTNVKQNVNYLYNGNIDDRLYFGSIY